VDELLGRDFGPYRIVAKIAEGGMAIVYKGYQESLNRYVAIKVLRKELTADRKFIARFRREALAVAKLSHPNILHIHDANLAHGRYYIAMEYLDGGSLKDLIARGPLPLGNALDIAIQLADALDYAHEEGLIHRDVKPANVLLTRSGRPKLADFGIVQALHERSALTLPGSSPGTPMYMSPEQAEGLSTDSRTDIYSLGIVLYEMITGRPPFSAPVAMATLYQQVNDPPPPIRQLQPQVPRWLEAAVNTALAKDPRDRYQQAGEFAAVLRQRQTPTPIRQTGSPEVTPTPIGRLKDSVSNWRPVPLLIVAILVVLLALLGFGVYLILANPLPDVTPTAQAFAPTPAPSATLSATISVPIATATPARSSTPTPTVSSTGKSGGSGPVPTKATSVPSPTPTSTSTHTPKPTPSVTPTRAQPTASPTTSPTRQTDTQDPTPRPTAPTATAVPSAGSLTGRIAFTVYNPGIGSYALYTVRPDGSELHPVLDYVHQPDISPDGRRIVVDGMGGGIDDLWSLKIDGSDRRQLTTHTDDRFPTWAPNGQSVAFSSTRQGDGLYRLYTIYAPIGTGKTKFVLGDHPVWLPTWEVVFTGCDYGWGTDTRCGLWRVSDGRQPLQITGNPQDVCTDGTAAEILFLRPDADNWDIYRMGLGGGNPTRLTDSPGNDGPAAFSPDGATIAFLSARSGRWVLYTMNRQGGNVKKVIDLPLGGNYNAAPLPWTTERVSWGPMPTQASPPPTPVDSHLLPAPQILFPIPDDTVSSRGPTTIRWSWSGELGSNQGFEVRFWPTSGSTPMGVAPPTTQKQLEVNFGLSDAYRQYGEGTYYLDVVVVQVSPYKVLSQSGRIRVRTDPNK
jgi:serine/threonine protein kinase